MKKYDLSVAMILVQMKLDETQEKEKRRLLTEVYEKLCRDFLEEVMM